MATQTVTQREQRPQEPHTKQEDGTEWRKMKLSEIGLHNRGDDCWVVIEGKVYDATPFVQSHPGAGLLVGCAGTDVTVNFHMYHFQMYDRAYAALKHRCKQVGVLDGTSPNMGDFWRECAAGVAEELKDEPRKPPKGQMLFIFDLLWYLTTIIAAWYMTAETPLWFAVLVTFLFQVAGDRLGGQAHAIGHLSVFPYKLSDWFGNLLIVLNIFGATGYNLPNMVINLREKMNETRDIAQAEFPNPLYRGPTEHQLIHHVKGAVLENDKCMEIVSFGGLMRIREDSKWKPLHRYQSMLAYRICCMLLIMMSYPTKWISNVLMVKLYMKHRELWWPYVVCPILGVFTFPIIFRARFITLITHGWWGLLAFIVMEIAKIVSGWSNLIFAAQHMWDGTETEESSAEDWGRANAETSVSVSGMWSHPVCWLQGGASAASLTYHLEHTLFAGVHFLYLPRLKKIVEAACKKHDVTFHTVEGFRDFNKFYISFLERYNLPSDKDKCVTTEKEKKQ